ncbi:MAG TPA: GspE/PulE family protein [Candidatus Baltobacteraceae bacterium]|nr:GspE/PulE family protein [Candidatus Baltobacteraceae bacterium]
MAATQDAKTIDSADSGFTSGPLQTVSPAVRALDEIQSKAALASCSDIHLEPFCGAGRVRVRQDGVLRELRSLPAELFAQVSSRVKILSGMDIAERRAPQDGRYGFEFQGRTIEARTSAMPTVGGEKIVVRLLDYSARVPRLEDLGMPADLAQRFRTCVRSASGFVIVCGPTGSGKTTTLYSALMERDVPADNVCTIEDPVEMRLPGLSQVEVNPRAGVSFASALRGMLRQDPNAVMVGELRDGETAAVASAASLSGVLVLASLHARDAVGSLERLRELGIEPRTLAAGLSCVVAQRLLRKICSNCAGCGCLLCENSGMSGRIAMFETLFVDDTIRDLISNGASSASLAAAARTEGFVPMADRGADLVRRGLTTRQELDRVSCAAV